MPLNQNDHGDVSWGILSEGWPVTYDMPQSKWCFANKSHVIPYGSYVLMDSDGKGETVKGKTYLRVENQALLDKLNTEFNIVFTVIKKELKL